MNTPSLLVLCATQRGVAFVRRLLELLPNSNLCVCSVPGEAWEPPYIEELEELVRSRGHRFLQCATPSTADVFTPNGYDLLLAVNWRRLIAPEVGALPRNGAFVFHDSLLPRYRGFSPTVWAMINGERETGVTLFRMVPEIDQGGIVDQQVVAIGGAESIGSVVNRVSAVYLTLLEQNLSPLLSGATVCRPQDETLATYACRRLPSDNRICWESPATTVYNLIRATSRPYPGAFCHFRGQILRIWSCDPPRYDRRWVGIVPGRVVERIPGHGVRVLAGDHTLLLREVQIEGGSVTEPSQLLTSLSDSLE